MSMLAERKRKQKWSLNPRGKAWSEDTTKFGQKLLEKMGWQHGKGLGAKEDGMTEHVKISYKNDTKGMGFKESDTWSEHDANFNALLKSLSKNIAEYHKPEELKLNSLEVKSQSSRARIHYHKFTRGKDLSRYSEKDLANIFGKKSLKGPTKQEQIEDEENTSKDKESTTKLEDSGFLVNAGSMKDYFKRKLSNFSKNNEYNRNIIEIVKKEESESESELRTVGFGFKAAAQEDTKSTPISYIDELNKKRRLNGNVDENIFSPKKKRKGDKNGSRNNHNQEAGLANPAFDPLSNYVKVQKHVLNTIPESCIEEDNVQPMENNDDFSVDNREKVNGYKTKNNAQRKTKVRESKMVTPSFNGTENPLFNEFDVEEVDRAVTNPYELKLEKRKNRNLKKKKNIEISVEALEKEISISNGTENPVFINNNGIDEVLQESTENPYEIKREKTKKKKKKINEEGTEFPQNIEISVSNATENPVFIDNNSIDEVLQEPPKNPYEIKREKKKKKKMKINGEGTEFSQNIKISVEELRKEISVSNAIENPVFIENNSIDEVLQESTENPYEIKREKKKKKKMKLSEESIEFPHSEEHLGSLNKLEKTNKTKKKKSAKSASMTEFIFTNPNFKEDYSADDSIIITELNPYEVELKPKKKKKKNKSGIENINFNESLEVTSSDSHVEENPYEVKPKKKKKKTLDSIETTDHYEVLATPLENPYEVKLSKKKKKKSKKEASAIDNPSFNANNSSEYDSTETESNLMLNISNSFSVHSSVDIEESDLMLNIASTPVMVKTKDIFQNETRITSSAKRRKSVRFSDVTQELIIPNNDEIRRMEQGEDMDESSLGVDNINFDKFQNRLDENLETISNTIDQYQAEVENDINEQKQITLEDIMVGEVGNPHGENEKLPNGTKLKFKYAHFEAKTPFYHLDKIGPRKGYKHLIKGDIILKFNNTNLHEIEGYALKKKVNKVL